MIKRNTYSLLSNYGFVAMWTGEAVSTLGSSFGNFAITWFMYEATQSKTAMGGVWLAYLLPSLLMQILAGPYLDRWNRKRILVLSQVSRALLFATLALLYAVSHLEPWSLYLASCLNGMIQPLYVPASLAALPLLVPARELTKANSYIDGTSRLMMFLGPPTGGLLVAECGIYFTLLLVVTLYSVSSFILAYLQLSNSPGSRKETWWHQFKEGYHYFFRQQVLLWLGIFIAAIQFAVGVTLVINLPYITDELGGSSFDYGLFIAGYPLGYFLGSILLGRFQPVSNKRVIMLGAFLLGGSSFAVLSVIHPLWLAIVVEVFSGVTAPFFHVHSTSLFQQLVPQHLLGRVLSVRLFIIRSAMPLGVLIAGLLGEVWGTRPLLAMIGGMICLTGIIGFTLPFFQFLDRPSAEMSPDE